MSDYDELKCFRLAAEWGCPDFVNSDFVNSNLGIPIWVGFVFPYSIPFQLPATTNNKEESLRINRHAAAVCENFMRKKLDEFRDKVDEMGPDGRNRSEDEDKLYSILCENLGIAELSVIQARFFGSKYGNPKCKD